ncbi:butyrophilin subfamily 1 member A1-like isoform X1 [Gopherus flavomarginatus]|uniref:butyrophilin subfamily 1 member A1-like isoform X1 n=1 Tax=Gopherus flavomarginatus TaxID=286002 RepID=UPI0021CBCFAF|nr:butyrophilin subfamily 1 member A1-like isoform X1 [Gopherus flavomarginatus]XP_050777265.1 butyrophilin subfamily 1 member A1-like isoform X1 [Gopherus flavomarginatus]XP_050777266.1 butyrophilin subfamily 1 member A1-like isoform X1 [Gopherus flavomarginatus]XP_050777267.1 butyrophilin subfamily 1 member A1-like isoform X1 [Gopherus flavomarginatus]XP_050777268.1 butyrophilin subfamily 1 member A1-like isoform X1 [Gopherus flavomarginatus]XP_050777269.1 butyrophilin subfamily 1 member A1-
MKLLSLHHGSTGSISLPGFIVFFINLPIYNLVSAQFTVIGPDQPVTAIVGEDIVLPCHLSPAMSAENMEVRWSRSDYSSFVHRYRDGKDQTEYQIPEYTGRTEFLKDGIRNGSVALRLHNIRPMDEGRYACYFESTSFYNDAHMELEVAALGAAPLLSVEGYQDGGIRVVCRSAGWYPEPEVFWRDLTGQHVPLLSERTFQEANGLFETETSIIITETSNQNISCSIRSTLLKQEKESRIYIAELFFPKKSFWIAIPCTIMVIQFFVIGFLIYHLKTKGNTLNKGRWRDCLTEAEKVTLDPDSANPYLILSKDQKRVRLEGVDKKLLANHEGFRYSPCVLASEGFTSGRHYWGVKVGSKGGWAVGVARESVRRKEGVVILKPEEGIWAVERQWWGEFWALTSPMTLLSLSRKPEKIRVSLDYEEGLVEFFDADNVKPFYAFRSVSFTGEKIFPFFRVGGAGAHLRVYL